MTTSETITDGVRVQVRSRFVPERSAPTEGHWFFAYDVRISNEGTEPVQLMSRHWIITDSNGGVQQVRGPGVVGEQPLLQPGQNFDYTSACPLRTSFGMMHGSYGMAAADGRSFNVEIAPFALGQPESIN